LSDSSIYYSYTWEGKLQEDEEAMLVIKTKTSQLEQLKDAIVKNHPYDVPEFISVPIEHGHSPYLKWINEQVDSPKTSDT
jgi:periplasmic divalent cation tolerance protein